MDHRHSLSLNLSDKRVFCMTCGDSQTIAAALGKVLVESRVEPVKKISAGGVSQDAVLVAVGTNYLASMLSVDNGVLCVRDLTRDPEMLEIFQRAIVKAFGIANIHDGKNLLTYTAEI